jgi:hypothetical protein
MVVMALRRRALAPGTYRRLAGRFGEPVRARSAGRPVSTRVAATLIGLIASFLLALAAFYQHRAARSTTRRGHTALGGAWALMSTLVRNRVWLTGGAVHLAGFGTQAVALHLGSVATVQRARTRTGHCDGSRRGRAGCSRTGCRRVRVTARNGVGSGPYSAGVRFRIRR